MRSALLAGMWEAAGARRNALGLPPAPEPEPGWRARLARAIRLRRADEPGAIAADLQLLRDAEVALCTDADLAAARDWLLSLGLSETDHPTFFPDALEALRERFAHTGRLDVQDRARLLTGGATSSRSSCRSPRPRRRAGRTPRWSWSTCWPRSAWPTTWTGWRPPC